MENSPWRKYKVGAKSTNPSFTEPSCQSFESVYHVCHVEDAIRIIEDGRIRSSLIWDESILSNTRTCVSWVSPNTWAYGSIYGHISFKFNWPEIVEGCRIYWVEDMVDYNPPAFRLLITDKDSIPDNVHEYDPTVGDGPIWKDGDTWRRNGNYTCEIMIDDDLLITRCNGITIEDHHKSICSKYGTNKCKDRVPSSRRYIGAILLSWIICTDNIQVKHLFKTNDQNGSTLTHSVLSSVGEIIYELENHTGYIGPLNKIESVSKIISAFLFAYSQRKPEKAISMLNLCSSKEEVISTFKGMVVNFFELDHLSFLDE